MIVVNPLQMRNIGLPTILKQYQADINLSPKLRNLDVVFYENLTLKYQVGAVKMKAIEGLRIVAKTSKIIRQRV